MSRKIKKLNLTNYDENDIFWRDFDYSQNPYKVNTDLSSLNCLFVFPSIKNDFSKGDYPISLGYMASLLRMNKGKAKILIQDVEEYNPSKFEGHNFICFYPMVASLDKILELATKVKKDYSNSKICFFNSDQHQHEMLLCNPKAIEFAKTMMERNSSLDYTLIGEAESSFIKLCEKVIEGNDNLENIPSCLYRKFGEIKISERPIEPVNFKFLPLPSRDFLEKSISLKGINSRSPRILSSRGCGSPCLYCAESSSNITLKGRKNPILKRNLSQFIKEIEMLQESYKVVFFNIMDSSFEGIGKKSIERVKNFCDEIRNRSIEASFKIHLRAETISKLDDKFLDDLKYAGVDIIGVGVESGLEKELKSYKKITRPQKSLDSVCRLESSGRFFSILGHMMFSPILKLEDLPKKIDFLTKIGHDWDYLEASHNIIIFRGTAYHNYIKSLGLTVKCDDLSPIIPYRFEDERVKYVAKEMGDLKIKCPEVIMLNNRLYDSMNIISRYYNKMNKHLWENQEEFDNFKGSLKDLSKKVGKVNVQYFSELVNLAEFGWSSKKANLIYEEYIPVFFPNALIKTNQLLGDFIKNCETKSLSTDKLYLKTWMSIINTQINTAGGKNK